MRRSLVPLVLSGALIVLPGAASGASSCAPERTSAESPAYCVPPATPAQAAHDSASNAASYLGTLSSSALKAKGGVKLPVVVSGKGTITIVLSIKVHGKLVVIGSGKRTVGVAGASTVGLVLTKAGKAAVGHQKGKLKVLVTATFKPARGKATTATGKATLT